MTNAFFKLILTKGRESYLPEISKEFLNQYKSLIGLTTVKLTTATPIEESNLTQIKSKLISSKETAKDVEIITAVDPKILGGFILQIGDKLFDNSIAFKLNQIKKNISNKDFINSI
jgi:F-type H+-transporting ATPase subunit delta